MTFDTSIFAFEFLALPDLVSMVLQAMARCPQPIPASCFNSDGTIFAYAVSYDWSKGAENHNPATATNHIYLHPTQDVEVKAKARVTIGRK